VAESLGAAVLTVSVDDAQLKAGLQAAERQAQQSGRQIEKALAPTGKKTTGGRQYETAANGLQYYIDAQGRARDASGKFLSVLERQAAGLDRVGQSATGASSGFSGLSNVLIGVGTKAAGAIAILETIRQVSLFTGSQITALDSAGAAVQTLGVDSDDLKKRLRALSAELDSNISQIDLTKAAYDVASSGFASAAEATDILRASALGAKGGFADVNDVASALTGVLNAYGLSASSATDIVDKFVQTQADGVITVRQYAAQIGTISSIAAAAGVSIDELNAAVATATLRGVPVAQTFTGLRQAISSIIKPSQQAQELAASLGLDYSVAALQSKGFAAVLADVQQKTGGSADKLAVLLGSVEAQAAIQPLLNDRLAKYNELLDKQSQAAGQAASASDINAKTISGGLQQIGNGFSNLATTLDTTLTPLFGGFIKSLNDILSKLNQVSALAPEKVLAREKQATDLVAANLGPLGLKGSGFFGSVSVPGASVGPQFKDKTFTGSATGVREDIIRALLSQDLAEINKALPEAGKQAGKELANGGTQAGQALVAAAGEVPQAVKDSAAIARQNAELGIGLEAIQRQIDAENQLARVAEGPYKEFLKQKLGIEETTAAAEDKVRSLGAQLEELRGKGVGVDSPEYKKVLNDQVLAQQEVELARAKGNNALIDAGNSFNESLNDASDKLAKASEQAAKDAESASNDYDSAAKSLRGALEGSFNLLTSSRQDSLTRAAQADINRAVQAGLFDSSKVGNLKGSELLSAASQARGIFEADSRLVKSNDELTKATSKLAEKDWTVNVAVNANSGDYAVQLG
jgi:TP901 family phage tail tape measure protein